jgi:hypothetical protein
MWVKLSPKQWEEMGSALRDAKHYWIEFVAAGTELKGDKAKTKRYDRIYRDFLRAPIERKISKRKRK